MKSKKKNTSRRDREFVLRASKQWQAMFAKPTSTRGSGLTLPKLHKAASKNSGLTLAKLKRCRDLLEANAEPLVVVFDTAAIVAALAKNAGIPKKWMRRKRRAKK